MLSPTKNKTVDLFSLKHKFSPSKASVLLEALNNEKQQKSYKNIQAFKRKRTIDPATKARMDRRKDERMKEIADRQKPTEPDHQNLKVESKNYIEKRFPLYELYGDSRANSTCQTPPSPTHTVLDEKEHENTREMLKALNTAEGQRIQKLNQAIKKQNDESVKRLGSTSTLRDFPWKQGMDHNEISRQQEQSPPSPYKQQTQANYQPNQSKILFKNSQHEKSVKTPPNQFSLASDQRKSNLQNVNNKDEFGRKPYHLIHDKYSSPRSPETFQAATPIEEFPSNVIGSEPKKPNHVMPNQTLASKTRNEFWKSPDKLMDTGNKFFNQPGTQKPKLQTLHNQSIAKNQQTGASRRDQDTFQPISQYKNGTAENELLDSYRNKVNFGAVTEKSKADTAMDRHDRDALVNNQIDDIRDNIQPSGLQSQTDVQTLNERVTPSVGRAGGPPTATQNDLNNLTKNTFERPHLNADNLSRLAVKPVFIGKDTQIASNFNNQQSSNQLSDEDSKNLKPMGFPQGPKPKRIKVPAQPIIDQTGPGRKNVQVKLNYETESEMGQTAPMAITQNNFQNIQNFQNLTFNRLEGFSSITSLENTLKGMDKLGEYVMDKDKDPELELLKFILYRMKETTHSQVLQNPFGDEGNQYEAYQHAKGLFPTLQQMQSEKDEQFKNKKDMRKDNYLKYIEEKLEAAKTGSKLKNSTKVLSPTEQQRIDTYQRMAQKVLRIEDIQQQDKLRQSNSPRKNNNSSETRNINFNDQFDVPNRTDSMQPSLLTRSKFIKTHYSMYGGVVRDSNDASDDDVRSSKEMSKNNIHLKSSQNCFEPNMSNTNFAFQTTKMALKLPLDRSIYDFQFNNGVSPGKNLQIVDDEHSRQNLLPSFQTCLTEESSQQQQSMPNSTQSLAPFKNEHVSSFAKRRLNSISGYPSSHLEEAKMDIAPPEAQYFGTKPRLSYLYDMGATINRKDILIDMQTKTARHQEIIDKLKDTEVDQFFLSKSVLGSKRYLPKKQVLTAQDFFKEVKKQKSTNLGIPIVSYNQLSPLEKNKLKQIEGYPIPKATESEWNKMKVMLPITKQGISNRRNTDASHQVVAAEALMRDSIDEVREEHELCKKQEPLTHRYETKIKKTELSKVIGKKPQNKRKNSKSLVSHMDSDLELQKNQIGQMQVLKTSLDQIAQEMADAV